ncbi:MAG: hypothetical protein WCK67_11925 [bacterium]
MIINTLSLNKTVKNKTQKNITAEKPVILNHINISYENNQYLNFYKRDMLITAFKGNNADKTQLGKIFNDLDKTMDKASDYLDKATKERDYKMKNNLAKKGLECLDQTRVLLGDARDFVYDSEKETCTDENHKIFTNKKSRSKDLKLELLKQAYALNLPKKTLKQMADFFQQRKDSCRDVRPRAELKENFEKGFIHSNRNFDMNGTWEIDMSDIGVKALNTNIQVNLEDDPVLVEASKKLNKKLRSVGKTDSMEVAKAILETESEFFAPEKPMEEEGMMYSDYMAEKTPCRIVNVGEYSSGSDDMPKATGTCLPQTMFTKAMAQLSDIKTTMVSKKRHTFLEYNGDDGKKIVIDPRNKFIFDLTDKEGLYYDVSRSKYMYGTKDQWNEMLDSLYNTEGDEYRL